MINKSQKYTLASEKSKQNRNKENIQDLEEFDDAGIQAVGSSEKAVDTTPLKEDIPEEFRESLPNELPQEQPNTTNWSAPEDRSEDLIELRDPFIQQDELDNEIPAELIQQRAYLLYEQRGRHGGNDLSDWFEAERQIREERNMMKKTADSTELD